MVVCGTDKETFPAMNRYLQQTKFVGSPQKFQRPQFVLDECGKGREESKCRGMHKINKITFKETIHPTKYVEMKYLYFKTSCSQNRSQKQSIGGHFLKKLQKIVHIDLDANAH